MNVRAYDPYISEADFAERGAERAGSLAALIEISDILTLHVPLTEETRRMIDVTALKRGSFLINASRGEVLDQQAALAALQSGHLAGLALDVFDPEPPVAPLPDDPRLIVTPHIGGCSFECKAEIGAMLYEKVAAFYRTDRTDRTDKTDRTYRS